MTRLIWGAIALVVALRALATFALPLTGDEAYYWEWSRRLAFGYIDHPPAVAWTIAAFAWLGHQPGFVRLGFVVCGVLASLALAAATTEISPSTGSGQARRAGAIAALALTLTPLASVVFGTASPDGPYLMFWALALWFAARAFKRNQTIDWVLLGIAAGGVLLSRVLGFALLFGLVAYSLSGENRRYWTRGIPVMLGVAFVVTLPFVVWNATHEWVTLAFALVHRHEQTHQISTLHVVVAQIAGYSPGIWVATILCAIRPKNALLAWTALPQFVVVMLLSLFEPVEFSWIAGFFVSLCAMLGLAYVELGPRARLGWSIATVVPASVMLALLFSFTFAPVTTYRAIVGATRLANGGPFEIWTYSHVAADAARLARERDAVVMTDGYGFSSAIDFDAGAAPVLIGYDWQGREARSWFPDTNRPARALFVDKEPLATRPDFAKQFARACVRVADGGRHVYRYEGVGARSYFFTWCDGIVPDGLAILRWER
jgi:4-amino-4-deoxy-L-arabinose transferase-like glycosyltransferase